MLSPRSQIANCVAALLVFSVVGVQTTKAQVPYRSFGPFVGEWDFDAAPYRGEVLSIEFGREIDDKATGKVEVRPMRQVLFVPQGDGTVWEVVKRRSIGPAKTIYDAKGRRIKIVSTFSEGNAGNSILATEVATYNPDGSLKEIVYERSDAGKGVATFTTEPTPDGKTLTMHKTDTDGKTSKTVFTYDKRSLLVGIRWSNLNPPAVLEYNDRGDVVSFQQGRFTKELFEVEYDEQGNWIKRKRFMSEFKDGIEKKSYRDTEVRKFSYGNSRIAPASKVIDTAVADDFFGTWKASRKTENALETTTTVILKKDRTLNYELTIAFADLPEKTIRKNAEGRWTLIENVLTINLEKAADGSAIPEAQRTLQCQVLPQAATFSPGNDPTNIFKRQP